MMNMKSRHQYILEQLKKDGYVKVMDLAERLDVSGATIRKDLRMLESRNLLHRTHGSAPPPFKFFWFFSAKEKNKKSNSN